jgi:hypothetical protein
VLTIKQIARRLRGTEGTEILEAAIVLPLVFLLLLGIVEFGRVFNIYSTIQQAAQQGATTSARATNAMTAGGSTFPTTATVHSAIFAVLQASNLNPSQIQLPPSPPNCAAGQPCSTQPCPPPYPPPPAGGPCAANANVYVCQNVQLNPTAPQPIQCGTVVSFQYPFQFNLPFTSLNLSQIILSAQAQSRMEN